MNYKKMLCEFLRCKKNAKTCTLIQISAFLFIPFLQIIRPEAKRKQFP